MQQLISIETVPISIEYVERKTPQLPNQQLAKLQIEKQDNTMSIKSSPILIKLDSFQPSSLNESNTLTYTATAQYSKGGSLSLNVNMGKQDQNTTYALERFQRGIGSITDFMSKPSVSPSLDMESMQIHFDMSQVSGGFPRVDNINISFIPPDLELKVLEMPRVIIKYVGGPIYIPKSSDPSYVPPENINLLFDGKSNFDMKA